MKHPIYFLFAAAVCGYLTFANVRGLSLLHSIIPTRLGPFGAATSHK
jgi:hypothetical protein